MGSYKSGYQGQFHYSVSFLRELHLSQLVYHLYPWSLPLPVKMRVLSLLSVATFAVASPLSVEDYAKALDERGKQSLSL